MGYRTLVDSLLEAFLLGCQLLLLSVIRWVPLLREIIWEKLHEERGLSDSYLCVQDWAPTLGGWQHVLGSTKRCFKEISRGGTIRLGDIPQEVELTNLITQQKCQLFTGKEPVAKEDRPLVMFFGSCTSVAFVTQLDFFIDMIHQFSDDVDFVIIYVREAHACDEWVIKRNKYNDVTQPQNNLERMDAARHLLVKDLPCPILIDSMKDRMATQFGGQPERVVIIHRYKMVHLSKSRYATKDSMESLYEWVEKYVKEIPR